MFEIITSPTSEDENVLALVKIDGQSFQILKQAPNGERDLFRWAILDSEGLAILHQVREKSFGILTAKELYEFNSFWQKNLKKLPFSLACFLAHKLKEKFLLRRNELFGR